MVFEVEQRETLRDKVLANPDIYPRASRELRKHPFLEFSTLHYLVAQDLKGESKPLKKVVKADESTVKGLSKKKEKRIRRGANSPILKLTAKQCKEDTRIGGARRALSMIREWQKLIDKKESAVEKYALSQELQLFVCSLTDKPQKKRS